MDHVFNDEKTREVIYDHQHNYFGGIRHSEFNIFLNSMASKFSTCRSLAFAQREYLVGKESPRHLSCIWTKIAVVGLDRLVRLGIGPWSGPGRVRRSLLN